MRKVIKGTKRDGRIFFFSVCVYVYVSGDVYVSFHFNLPFLPSLLRTPHPCISVTSCIFPPEKRNQTDRSKKEKKIVLREMEERGERGIHDGRSIKRKRKRRVRRGKTG